MQHTLWRVQPKKQNNSDVIEDVGPPLHGDALEDGDDGEVEGVEVGDAVRRALPALEARRVRRALATAVLRRRARLRVQVVLDHCFQVF